MTPVVTEWVEAKKRELGSFSRLTVTVKDTDDDKIVLEVLNELDRIKIWRAKPDTMSDILAQLNSKFIGWTVFNYYRDPSEIGCQHCRDKPVELTYGSSKCLIFVSWGLARLYIVVPRPISTSYVADPRGARLRPVVEAHGTLNPTQPVADREIQSYFHKRYPVYAGVPDPPPSTGAPVLSPDIEAAAAAGAAYFPPPPQDQPAARPTPIRPGMAFAFLTSDDVRQAFARDD